MTEPAIYRIFLSSTTKDLLPFRLALKKHLEDELNQVTIEMNGFGALLHAPAQACELEVARCDIFIGIYAFRYGEVPDGSAISITQSEYERCRSLGKRCLCFVADESLREELPTDDEPPSRKELLQQFRKRLETELTPARFSSLEELKTKAARSFLQFLSGDPIGFYPQDVVSRWLAWQQAQCALYRENRGISREDTVASPLWADWRAFCAEPPWYEYLVDELSDAAPGARTVGLHDLAGELELLREESPSGNYHALADRLLRVSGQGLAALRPLTERRPEGTQTPSERDWAYHCRELARSLRDLRDEAQTPRYQKAFLVMGGIGAGKTHFIAELMRGRDRTLLVLPVAARSGDLRQAVERGIIEATNGLQWRSLEEFHQLLEANELRLVLALDDLQEWQRDTQGRFEQQLLDFMANHTALHQLFWLVTLQETAYDTAVLNREVWKRYGFQPDPDEVSASGGALERWVRAVGPWLMLDHLNIREQTGLRMIENGLSAEDYRFFRSYYDEVPESQPMLEQLCSPFFAALFIGMHAAGSELATLVNLHHIDLVLAFWEKLSATLTAVLASRGLDRSGEHQALKDLAYLTAVAMARMKTVTPLRARLVEEIAAESRGAYPLADRQTTDRLLGVLIEGHLLQVIRKKEGPLGRELDHVGLGYEIFWMYQLACSVLEMNQVDGELREDVLQQLEGWLATLEADHLREGVLEFVLLTLDKCAADSPALAARLPALWRGVLDARGLPAAALWFAAGKARLIREPELLDWAGQTRLYPDRHLLFSFMYYLGSAPGRLQELLPKRLGTLQRYYRDIRGAQLQQYFVFLFSRIFDRCERVATVVSCMACMAGCEVLETDEVATTQELADIAVSKLLELAGWEPEPAREAIWAFLQADREHAARQYHPSFSPDQFLLQGKEPGRLCRAIAQRTATTAGADEGIGWLNRLLERADLFELLTSHLRADQQWSARLADRAARTRPFRAAPLDRLAGGDRFQVLRLNRAAIEEFCPEEAPRSGGAWQRHFFREWVLCMFSRWLVEEKKVDAYYWWVEHHWYSAKVQGMQRNIASEMEREANIALGNHYYDYTEEQQKVLYQIAEDLIDTGAAHDTETAFHIVRHTTPTHGRDPAKIWINPRLHDLLRLILLRGNTDYILPRYRELFRYNLKEEFDPLYQKWQERQQNRGRGKP